MALATGIRVALLTGMTGSAIMEYSNNQRIETSCQSILIFNAQLTSTLLNNEVVHMMLFNRYTTICTSKSTKKSVSFLPGLKS